ncbi:serine/threonine-protein kinase [Microbacterium hominis]|uniref:Protein kinase n=1 Tax=Microbacterium hominis TaxID=162426 RepID=A0A7D4TDF4_9MICO|nr:serine/threonine-protein kinase [Microbacterium hominis]QKJ18040.1 protein kinase [Microbacterium hominis]
MIAERAGCADIVSGMGMTLDQGTWDVVAPFDADAGAFAKLYLVTSANGDEAVAKCMPVKPGAQRELLFSESIQAAGYANVMPVVDFGEHEGYYVVVMPRAEMSLKQYVERHPAGVPLENSLAVLDDVAAALAQINDKIVHRDIKPANVLLHEGSWKLADFGVSRYVEAATATETRRASFTHAYAAPEQWRHETTSGRTDVYSFGVMAYELIERRRPFQGPQFREEHLHEIPPEMDSGTPKLRQLIRECLLKDPATRPAPDSLQNRLRAAEIDIAKHGTAKLAVLRARRTAQISAEQARDAAERDAKERLESIVEDAAALLNPIARAIRAELVGAGLGIMFDTVLGNAAPIFRAKYERALLEFDRVDPVESAQLPFTVHAYASITVDAGTSANQYRGLSHSLWFCDAQEQGRFAWYELAFRSSTGGPDRSRLEPFSRPPWSVEQAFAQAAGDIELAWPPTELALADPNEFVQRWIGWFADAADGNLARPSTPATGPRPFR